MIFTIADMDKMHRNFIVTDATGARLPVKGVQIVAALADPNNKCTNAKLIKDGICINTPNGIIEVKPQMSDDLRKHINKMVNCYNKQVKIEQEQRETAIKAQIAAARSETISTAEAAQKRKAEAIKNMTITQSNKLGYIHNTTRKISDKPVEKVEKIYYQGTLYSSPEALCRAAGCTEVERFKELYAAGYEKEICLGLKPLDSNMPKPQPRYKQVDRLLRGLDSE